MSLVSYAERVLNIKLSFYQKELLSLLHNSKDKYLYEMSLIKKPSMELKQVIDIYNYYTSKSLEVIV